MLGSFSSSSKGTASWGGAGQGETARHARGDARRGESAGFVARARFRIVDSEW